MSVILVDGQEFEVRERPDEPGHYDFVWLSGPNDGYGFSSSRSDAGRFSGPEMAALVRSFLAQVNSATGYID
jgi:hypothetical protein